MTDDAVASNVHRPVASNDAEALPVLLFDPHWHNLLSVNAAAQRCLGYSAADCGRLTIIDLVCAADRLRFMRAIEPGAPDPGTVHRWCLEGRDGRRLEIDAQHEHLEFRGMPAVLLIARADLKPDADAMPAAHVRGEPRRPVADAARAVDVDVTSADTAALRSRIKTEFLARLSHELRTPLNAVIGFSELLAAQAGNAEPTHARYLEHILDAGRHLLALVDDVLDLQRVDERRLPLRPRPLDLAEFVAAETEMLSPLLEKQSLTMLNDVPAGLVVQADEKCLRQALINLATNAIKYNRPSGSVRWSASVTRPGFGRLTLSDTGQGMTGEQIPRLFQPFDRLGMETSAHGGSGLGVLIAKGLVEYMGGRLDIESKLGVGTHVTIELPLAEPHSLFGDLDGRADLVALSPSRVPIVHAAAIQAQSNLMPTLRLLYVEDNRINAMLFEAVLGTRPDIELRIAETGWEALDVVDTWTPDVLVLDANLPDIHGVRLLRQMRELDALRSTPAFMCSADAMEEDVQAARAAGFRDYWTKPIDFAKVLADLRTVASPARPADGS